MPRSADRNARTGRNRRRFQPDSSASHAGALNVPALYRRQKAQAAAAQKSSPPPVSHAGALLRANAAIMPGARDARRQNFQWSARTRAGPD